MSLQHPARIRIVGPSGVGKTMWLVRLLREKKIQPEPHRVIICYSKWQPLYEEMKNAVHNIEFVKGIPPDLGEDGFFDPAIRTVIVFDDLMTDVKKDTRIADLFTKGSHHDNASVVYIAQNLFDPGKASRDIDLNCQYINNPVDRQQVALLGRRIYPGKGDYFMKRYEEAVTSSPHGSLLIDLKPTTSEDQRLKGNFLQQTGKGKLYTKVNPPWFKQQDGNGEIQRDVWHDLFGMSARAMMEGKVRQKAEGYVAEGYSERESRLLTEEDYLPDMKQRMLQNYSLWCLNSDKDSIHRSIQTTRQTLQKTYNMSHDEAMKQSLKLREGLLEQLWDDE